MVKDSAKLGDGQEMRLEVLGSDSEASTPGALLGEPLFLQNMSPIERAVFEKKLLRRIDVRLMPMTVLMYIMNYLDRNNIASARIAGAEGKGLQDELDLSSTQYQTAISILFVGYILYQIPSNLILNKIGYPAIYLSTFMMLWGVLSCVTGAVKSFSGLLVCRFFLGFLEAAYFPGVIFLLSCWYTRKEIALRSALLFSGSLISGGFSGLISAGITHGMDGVMGHRAWRWLFFIEGAITVVIAFAAVFVLPNFPQTTSWLSEEEKQYASWRLKLDVGEDDWTGSADQGLMRGIFLAVRDIKVILIGLLMAMSASSGSVALFFPSVVQTLNFGTITTLLLTTPPYILAMFTCMANAWHADRTGERFKHLSIPFLIAGAAFAMAAATTNVAARYTAFMIMIPGLYSGHVVALAWVSNTIARPAEKRAAAFALTNTIANCASIWGSYFYPQSSGPRYAMGFAIDAATAVVAVALAYTLKVILQNLNNRLDRGEHLEGVTKVDAKGETTRTHFRFLY